MNQAIDKIRQQIAEEQRQHNRAQMPGLASLMDELNRQFPGCKLIYGEEIVGGERKTIGNKSHEPNTFTIPHGYAPCETAADILKKSKNRSKA